LQNPIAAWCLALETSVQREEATALLGALIAIAPLPTASRNWGDDLRNRMAAEPLHDVGLDGPRAGPNISTPQDVASFIIAADKKRRGEAP
jgi:hypothetical protein